MEIRGKGQRMVVEVVKVEGTGIKEEKPHSIPKEEKRGDQKCNSDCDYFFVLSA
jgi:hypothetical protein